MAKLGEGSLHDLRESNKAANRKVRSQVYEWAMENE
jgi:hypothetical protein